MKKLLEILLIAIVTISAAACVEKNDNVVDYQTVQMTFDASFTPDTRTVLAEGNQVYWEPGDMISISGASEPFTATIEEPAPITTFVGSAAEAAEYYAVYPYSKAYSWDGSVVTLNVSDSQYAENGGTFPNYYSENISVAKSSGLDKNFVFHNILGYIKFSIPEELGSIIRMSVRSYGGEPLAGRISIDCAEESPEATVIDNASTYVQLKRLAFGYPEFEPGTYYIALLPGTYSEGLSFVFEDSNGKVAQKSIRQEITLSKGQIRNIGSIADWEFKHPVINPEEVPDNEIWYVSVSGSRLNKFNNDLECDVNLVDHYYIGNKGVLVYDGPVKEVSTAQGINETTEFYLPDCVEKIDRLFPYWVDIEMFLNSLESDNLMITPKTFYIPANLKFCPPNLFICSKITKLVGKNVSEDGRCVVIDGELKAFAGWGLEEYTIPSEVTSIADNSMMRWGIKKLVIPENVTYLGSAIYEWPYLYEIHLPDNIVLKKDYHFRECNNIGKIVGRNDYITEDNVCIKYPDYAYGEDWILKAATNGLTEYRIPEGIGGLEHYSFMKANTLTKIYFPSSLKYIAGSAFEGTYSISEAEGPNVLDDGRSLVVDDELLFVAGAGLNDYKTPEGVKVIGYGALQNQHWKNVIISDDVDKVASYGYLFRGNTNLESITISARLQDLGYDPFGIREGTTNLKTIYCRATIPPKISWNYPQYSSWYKIEGLKIYVPRESLDLYLESPYWELHKECLTAYDYTDLPSDISLH